MMLRETSFFLSWLRLLQLLALTVKRWEGGLGIDLASCKSHATAISQKEKERRTPLFPGFHG